MDDQQFKDMLSDWHAECVEHERNSGLHTQMREAAIVEALDAEYAEMLAYVERLRADAQLGAMVRRTLRVPGIDALITQENFFDAVRKDEEISDEDRAYWLSFEKPRH